MKAYKNLLMLYIALISTSLFSFFGDSATATGGLLGAAAGGRKGLIGGLAAGAVIDTMRHSGRRDPYYDGRYYNGGGYYNDPYYGDGDYYDDGYYGDDRYDRQYRGRRPISKRY